jgi:hypothetical protein
MLSIKAQILSLAIALPMVIASTASSFAGETVQISQQTDPTVTTETIQKVASITVTMLGNHSPKPPRPGEGVRGPKPSR